MTNKEELIKAAEVLESYCKEHMTHCCKEDMSACLLSSLCDLLPYWSEVRNVMFDVAQDVRESDD